MPLPQLRDLPSEPPQMPSLCSTMKQSAFLVVQA